MESQHMHVMMSVIVAVKLELIDIYMTQNNFEITNQVTEKNALG